MESAASALNGVREGMTGLKTALRHDVAQCTRCPAVSFRGFADSTNAGGHGRCDVGKRAILFDGNDIGCEVALNWPAAATGCCATAGFMRRGGRRPTVYLRKENSGD